jgi:hypothetical protein
MKGRASVKAPLLVLLAISGVMALPIARCLAASSDEPSCKEPLPEFTLGQESQPTKDQESALCACIWSNFSQSERVTSENIRQNKLSQISTPERNAFISQFGDVLEKCGGMKL